MYVLCMCFLRSCSALTLARSRSNRLTIKDTGKLAESVEEETRSLTLDVCPIVEQRILTLQEKKQSLADAATGEGNGQSKSPGRDDVRILGR